MTERSGRFLIAALLVMPGAPLLSLGGVQEPLRGRETGLSWEAPAGLQAAASQLVPETLRILAEARAWTGLPPDPRPIHLEFVGSRQDLAEALGYDVPDWFGAVAIPGERRMVLLTTASRSLEGLRVTLRHEIMHLAMADLGLDSFRRIPSWFHEGCAQVFAGDVLLGNAGVALSWRGLTGSLLRLSDFRKGFGKETLRAAEGYALAEAFVARLVREHGGEVVPRLLARVAAGASLDAALVEETGFSVVTHEERLRSELTSPLALVRDLYPHLFLGITLLALITVPFVISRRRRRRRELEEKWDRDRFPPPDPVTDSGQWRRPPRRGENEKVGPLEGWIDEDM